MTNPRRLRLSAFTAIVVALVALITNAWLIAILETFTGTARVMLIGLVLVLLAVVILTSLAVSPPAPPDEHIYHPPFDADPAEGAAFLERMRMVRHAGYEAARSDVGPTAVPSTPAGHGITARAKLAARYDARHGGRRQAGPYTIGTLEHASWRAVYDAEFALVKAGASCPAA